MDTEKIIESIGIDGQIAIMRSGLETVCDGLFHLYYGWRRSKEKEDVPESDAIAQCILQMVVCKIRTLLIMCDGINVRPEKDTIRILDIPSLISVLRSLYEMVFVFHNIYAEQGTKEGRDIVLYIFNVCLEYAEHMAHEWQWRKVLQFINKFQQKILQANVIDAVLVIVRQVQITLNDNPLV
jgi:hypothetical protein